MHIFPRRNIILGLVVFFFFSGPSFSQTNSDQFPPSRLKKLADDDATKFTDIGNVRMTITNFGTLGTNFNNWPAQPSCEYPKGSRIENLALGGLWIGGIRRSLGYATVSTACQDGGNPLILGAGFEFTNEPGSQIGQRSSLSGDTYFNINAVSHQDFVMDFTDRYTRDPQTGDSIQGHTPLGVSVHLETYAWNFPFSDFFVILNYTIKNVSNDTIDAIYVGMRDEGVVRNMNLSGYQASSAFFSSGKGYIDSLRLAYTFDVNGQPYGPPANSYWGMKLLGTDPFPLKRDSSGAFGSHSIDSLGDLHLDTYYNGWKYNNTTSGTEQYFYPDVDNNPSDPLRGKYQRMSTMQPKNFIQSFGTPLNTPVLSDGVTPGIAPSNTVDLISVGPFPSLAPGDSMKVVFGVVCAKKSTNLAPSEDYHNASLRKTFYSNASWAQQAYDGEDLNGNNKLDPGEDINGDGKLTRYVLPQPPRQPRVRAVVENQEAIIYWDRTQAEESFNPISRRYDFEGYRIYRSAAGADIKDPTDFILSMDLVGDFDRADDNIGYNTGFSAIKLSSPKMFPGDTVQYWYRFPPVNDNITSLNGWQYLYGISAYNQGDSANQLPSLESAKVIVRVIPGTPPTSEKSAEIGVYPNPYYAGAAWDGSGERDRKIYFYNLPARADIKIYTLSGDLVTEITHDAATYTGSDIKWFQNFSGLGVSPQFAGGEHAWDLISKYDQAIATGLYLFTVKDLTTGTIKRGKFVVIK
ncbi:MAG TPA: hypothetical protein VMF88_01855 [Bacteroidota bacterium]|nr:hypothetical protein [Bacteroidota bacterium]